MGHHRLLSAGQAAALRGMTPSQFERSGWKEQIPESIMANRSDNVPLVTGTAEERQRLVWSWTGVARDFCGTSANDLPPRKP